MYLVEREQENVRLLGPCQDVPLHRPVGQASNLVLVAASARKAAVHTSLVLLCTSPRHPGWQSIPEICHQLARLLGFFVEDGVVPDLGTSTTRYAVSSGFESTPHRTGTYSDAAIKRAGNDVAQAGNHQDLSHARLVRVGEHAQAVPARMVWETLASANGAGPFRHRMPHPALTVPACSRGSRCG